MKSNWIEVNTQTIEFIFIIAIVDLKWHDVRFRFPSYSPVSATLPPSVDLCSIFAVVMLWLGASQSKQQQKMLIDIYVTGDCPKRIHALNIWPHTAAKHNITIYSYFIMSLGLFCWPLNCTTYVCRTLHSSNRNICFFPLYLSLWLAPYGSKLDMDILLMY